MRIVYNISKFTNSKFAILGKSVIQGEENGIYSQEANQQSSAYYSRGGAHVCGRRLHEKLYQQNCAKSQFKPWEYHFLFQNERASFGGSRG